MNDSRARSRAYDGVMIWLGGSAIGWFVWWFLGGYGGLDTPLWPFAVGGMALALGFVSWQRRRTPSGRSWLVHLLWIPAILLGLLMVSVVIAMRNWQ